MKVRNKSHLVSLLTVKMKGVDGAMGLPKKARRFLGWMQSSQSKDRMGGGSLLFRPFPGELDLVLVAMLGKKHGQMRMYS